MPSDIFWFPAIWLAAAAGSFLRYLNRGPKELFFSDNRHGFSGGCGGGAHPPRNDLHPPPNAFGTHANYIYFDLIVSYLIILTTKFVKLPILWSQILPCRPRKQILLNIFLGLSGRCHRAPAKASSSTPPDIYPPPRTKIWKSVSERQTEEWRQFSNSKHYPKSLKIHPIDTKNSKIQWICFSGLSAKPEMYFSPTKLRKKQI